MVRFMRYLKEGVGKEEMSEISLADKLEMFRRESKNFLNLSFDTICGYASNGAIVHYSATPETDKRSKTRGCCLWTAVRNIATARRTSLALLRRAR